MPTWTIKADQRQADYEELVEHLELLAQSVQGLSIEIVDASTFFDHPDGGGFRAFAPLATLSHPRLAVLETLGEELVADLGWLIDLSRHGE